MKTYEETAQSILERRTEYRHKRKSRNKVIASVLALCIAAGAGTGFYLTHENKGKVYTPVPEISSTVDEADASQGSYDSGTSASVNSEIGEIANQRSALSDVMAYLLLRYDGRDYAFRDRTEEKFADKHIGHTTHGYGDENGYSDINGGWRNAEELSCDVGGEIYTVKGFSPEFALCIKSDVNGKYYAFCNFDLEISTGNDLLGEKAYNLKSNIVSAKYQPHSEWDIGLVNYRQLDGVDKADLERLIDSICRSDVIDSDESYEKIITDDVIKTQRHIILNMGESWPFRTITFRMYEGGYVWIESLCAPGVLFKVDDPVFGKIYNAAKDVPVTAEQIRAQGLSPDDFD